MTDMYQIDSTKIMLHPQRVAQWLDAGDNLDALMRVPPIYVEISPVGQCNHRCTFCSVDYIGYKRRQLVGNATVNALFDMAEIGVKSVMFAGEGEPLLHPNIGTAINISKRAGLDVSVTTNATALTSKLAEDCLGSVMWLKASINGGTPEVYAKVHQTKPQDFHRVLDNLATVVNMRFDNKWPVTIGAQIVLLPENRETVVPLAQICASIGLDYLVVKPYSQNPNSTETATRGFDKFDYRECDDLAAQLEGFNTDTFKVIYRSKTMANLDEPEREYKMCHSTPFFWAYIMATGDVYGCSAHLLDERFNFGNINQQSFSEIWHGEKRRACIEMMRSFDLSSCRKNCRMDASNRFLWKLRQGVPHQNFI